MQTSFGNAMDIGARTDALAKNLISHKIFLAKLMKECVPEFAQYDPADIAAQYIEGNPEIGTIPVNRDELADAKITGMNTEDSSATEQTIRFDIRFRAIVPNTKEIMERRYRIAITEDIEREMNEMCNLSQSIEQRGIEIGEQRGIKIGEQRGSERALIEALRALVANMGLRNCI